MASNPTKIGKYDVEGTIGRGGMGVVYKAVDSQIGRYVAIKMITSDGDESLIARFKSEARSTGSLQCPNIVTVYDVGEQDGNPYLVMQFLEGPSLESMLKKGTALTLPECLGIVIDVCTGLGYAHQRGVIHRDIKPANIIVLQDGINDGMAVIVDFGIARIVGDTGLTKANQIIGSIFYMSSEQLQAKELDNRTDVYSLGVVLFQLLTGSLPFEANEAAATFHKILNDPPPPLSAYLKEYPAELDAIISRVLAKKREDRYATAQDLAFDLMRIQDQVKSETVGQLFRRAEVAVDQGEWTQAREQLQQALRIDRHNTRAQKLMSAVHERLRLQQEIERARALRNQANEAYMDQRYEDALHLLDQAVALDAKNNDLLAFRDSVRAAMERATKLRRALRRAEAALQDGNIDEAQIAVDDAVQIDPSDTQAKALKVIVYQHAEEKSRQQQLRKLLDQARDQIAARDLTAAFATLKTAEALDPTSNELQAVAKMAATAREQEKRRSEAEEMCRQIEAALIQEDYSTAVARADEGLQKFPQERSLIKLKVLAEAQRGRVEQKKYVREQFAAASALADSGQVPEALAALDRALQKVPGSSELETFRATLRDRVAAEEAEQRKARAIDATLAKEARRVLEGQGALSAREFLDSHATPYGDSPQVRALYEAVREREKIDSLNGRLAAEPNPAKRVQIAEEAVRENPDNQAMRQVLADAERVRAQISAAIERARGFELAKRYAEAIQEWQQLSTAQPQIPEFEAQVKRLAVVSEQAKQGQPKQGQEKPKPGPEKQAQEKLGQDKKAAPIPAAQAPAPSLPPEATTAANVAPPSGSLSATRVLGSRNLRDTAATANKPVPVVAQTAATAPDKGTASPAGTTATSAATQRKLPASDVLRQLATFVEGNKKSVVFAGGALVVVFALVAAYLLLSGGKKTVEEKSAVPIQVHIVANPADAVVTKGSQPVENGTVSLVPGSSVTVEVSRLGYKTKSVELRQASDGNVVLDPEPLHLSIQTSEKSGTVELDANKIADLADGDMEGYDFVPDGNSHQLTVSENGKQLFAVQLQATPGALPQVDTFDAKGLFLITSLGNSAKLYAGSQLKNVRLGDQSIAVSPSGADLSLSEQNREVKFGEGSGQGSVPIENSNAPTLAVYSTNLGGQVQITSNVAGATLTVNGAPVKSQGGGWLVKRPPGAYTFDLSADGYESQKWTMTLLSRQVLPNKNVNLKPKAQAKAGVMAALVIVGGTPDAQVDVDGARAGKLDANGDLELPNTLTEGQHKITLSKQYYDSHEFGIVAKLPEFRLTDAKLAAWAKVAFQTTVANVTVKYQRSGDSQVRQANASDKLVVPPGQYDFTAEAPGFQKYDSGKVNLPSGFDGSIPLKLNAALDYQYQDVSQIIHDGPEWIKAKDSHAFVHLKPGLLHEQLIFAKPGKVLLWNKKVEWRIETADNSARVEYVLDGQKLQRRLVVKDEASDSKETPKVDVAALNQATSLLVYIQVDGSHVQISNAKGVILDDYVVPQKANFSGVRISIKTDSQFVVRDK
jgi:eukaryotic-like serine/threonine-protein kinase